jgi:aspartate aminotransferase
MSVSVKMKEFSTRSSWIRKMFEEGTRLKAEFGAENIFDFSLGNPDLSPPPGFHDCLRQIVEEEAPGVHGYMPNGGFPHVREAVAAQLASEQGVAFMAGDVLMTCGAAGALNVVLKAVLDPGDEVLIMAPFFVEYNFYVDNHGGKTVVVPTDRDFNLDLSAIECAITDKTKAVLINSPNNPTGQIYSLTLLKGLAGLLEREGKARGRQIYLLSDEPYRKIVYDHYEVPSVLQAYERSIVVSSFSKDLSLPGERIGYIAVHPEMADKTALLDALTLANRILGFVNAPAIMQRVVAGLQGVNVDTSIYARRRELFCRILQGAGYSFIPPKGAFYIFPRAPMESDVDFVAILQRHKILAVPGRGFGMPGYFRLAFCVDDSVIERSASAFAAAIQVAGQT